MLKTRTKIEYTIKRQTNQASVGCCLISQKRVLKNGAANTQPTATIRICGVSFWLYRCRNRNGNRSGNRSRDENPSHR